MLAPVRPRMQAAGLQCLKLHIAVASPDPQTRASPVTQVSRKSRSPKNHEWTKGQREGDRGTFSGSLRKRSSDVLLAIVVPRGPKGVRATIPL